MPAGAGADGALLEKLRAVRAFADLTGLPGRVSLADELQRHRKFGFERNVHGMREDADGTSRPRRKKDTAAGR